MKSISTSKHSLQRDKFCPPSVGETTQLDFLKTIFPSLLIYYR